MRGLLQMQQSCQTFGGFWNNPFFAIPIWLKSNSPNPEFELPRHMAAMTQASGWIATPTEKTQSPPPIFASASSSNSCKQILRQWKPGNLIVLSWSVKQSLKHAVFKNTCFKSRSIDWCCLEWHDTLVGRASLSQNRGAMSESHMASCPVMPNPTKTQAGRMDDVYR